MREKMEEGESQRGPSAASKKVYMKRAPQQFMEEVMATGRYHISVDETTGQGVFVGQFNPTSYKTESGKDVALVLFEVFLADSSKCCKAETKRKKKDGVFGPHICKACGNECEVTQEWIRKPTYIPNPRTGARVAIWNQCICQWSLIQGVLDGAAKLFGGAVTVKKEEIRSAQEVVEDKRMAELRKYAL
jgi:hypothetical protein